MLLAKYDRIYADPFESVDIYTKQCSVGVNATQLARMGATLANNGINPATGEQVIKAEARSPHSQHDDRGWPLRRFRWLGLACGIAREERSWRWDRSDRPWKRRYRRLCTSSG